jgi:hypothetical protein
MVTSLLCYLKMFLTARYTAQNNKNIVKNKSTEKTVK